MTALRRDTDIVIGMVTAGSSPRLGGMIREIAAGMGTYFPQYSYTLVHATSVWPLPVEEGPLPEVVSIPVERFGIHLVTYPWHGVPAKTNGYRAILDYAKRANAGSCLLVDPNQVGFEASWVDSLLRPALHSQYDLVTPVYHSCAREQLLSTNLLSPLLRVLFGQGPKQPAASELLISKDLRNRLLARWDWDSAVARYTPEMWMCFIALAEGFRVAESTVGAPARATDRRLLPTHAGIAQIVGGLFNLMDQYEARWAEPGMVRDLDRFGPEVQRFKRPATNGLDYLEQFVRSMPALRREWQTMLDPETFAEIEAVYTALLGGRPDHLLSDAAWVRIVYETAGAWKQRLLPPSQVIGLFIPLFLARAGSFLWKTQWLEEAEIEAELGTLDHYFEGLQPVLPRLWKGEAEKRPRMTGLAIQAVERK